jgi:hypothetical protein
MKKYYREFPSLLEEHIEYVRNLDYNTMNVLKSYVHGLAYNLNDALRTN